MFKFVPVWYLVRDSVVVLGKGSAGGHGRAPTHLTANTPQHKNQRLTRYLDKDINQSGHFFVPKAHAVRINQPLLVEKHQRLTRYLDISQSSRC